jgi:hypothetical protein
MVMFISLTGCITFTCDEAKSAGVVDVSGPSMGIVGEDIAISVTFCNILCNNGCVSFHSLSDSLSGNVIMEGKVKYTGCICPEVLVTFVEQYIFNASTPGPYDFFRLRFKWHSAYNYN